MSQSSLLHLPMLFEDGGELLKTYAQDQPRTDVLAVATDHESVVVREDSYQVTRLGRGDTIELQGVYVDGSQLWQFPDIIDTAASNVTSYYGEGSGEDRLLQPLFDRSLAQQLSLRPDVSNRALRARIRMGLDGEVYSFDHDLVRARVLPIDQQKCGKMLRQRKHGGLVLDTARAALAHMGYGDFRQLERDFSRPLATEDYRIASAVQTIFANFVFSKFAEQAFEADIPFLYRATQQKPRQEHGDAFHTAEPKVHLHNNYVYCTISPAFRELTALITQSLVAYYRLGGKESGVNTDVLTQFADRVNDAHKNYSEKVAQLENMRAA